jgi:hypothetical protein
MDTSGIGIEAPRGPAVGTVLRLSERVRFVK